MNATSTATDPVIEYYRIRALRGEIDHDIAEMQIAAYMNRASAVREPKLANIPRPKPLKFNGLAMSIRKTG